MSQPQSITAINVKKLFGLYTYTLPHTGQFSEASILYGDNGAGKSTLLRLAFHLVSSAHNRGHRTALFQTSFDLFEVHLSSGHIVRVQREPNKRDILRFSIEKGRKVIAGWNFVPDHVRTLGGLSDSFQYFINSRGKIIGGHDNAPETGFPKGTPVGADAYHDALSKIAPTVFILDAERKLDSDSIPDPSDEVEYRRYFTPGQSEGLHDLVQRSRQIALTQALNAAAKWISRKAIARSNEGAQHVNSVYIDVLKRITSHDASVSSDFLSGPELLLKVEAIEETSEALEKYELASAIDTSQFRKALSSRNVAQRTLAIELLKPYLQSLESRLAASIPLYAIVDRFVRMANALLRDKTLKYQLSRGFEIENRLGDPLKPEDLSSGEQQLLLLFCNVLSARDQPSVFMIDEPELSLNLKWQRTLVQSLLEITDGSPIQFIFASHSMELLTQHRNRVVKLVEQE